MLQKESGKPRGQIRMVCIEELVPQDHLLRKVEAVMDWSFIYPLVENRYSKDKGRPSLDPVMLVKIAVIQYMFGIRSMRQTIKDIEVNTAYRWFLGLDLIDPVPHFTTFGKNYYRRFADNDLFENIFAHVLEQCMKRGYVKEGVAFVDATHTKASANKNKKVKARVQHESRVYERELRNEINRDRETHGKKPFENEDDDDETPPENKITTQSTTDPDSGMFVKGEHERSFAYETQTACDASGFVLAYDVCAGNIHDSVSFWSLYEKLKAFDPAVVVMDTGYRTPAILRRLLLDGRTPLIPRKGPMTKRGFFRKYDYVYDEQYDCYICPNNKTLGYSTTNREGYKEYKSKPYNCVKCPYLKQCTHSREHVKTITRHVWQEYVELADDYWYGIGMRDIYRMRKETIERVFADAKDKHGMRYTQLRGLARVKSEVGLRFACMNLKKLANWAWREPLFSRLRLLICYLGFDIPIIRKEGIPA